MRWLVELAIFVNSLFLAYLLMLMLWPIIMFYVDALNSMAP